MSTNIDSAAPGAVRLPKDYEWDGQSENMKWFAGGYNSALRDVISINTCVSKLERTAPGGDVERMNCKYTADSYGNIKRDGVKMSANEIIAALSAPKQAGDVSNCWRGMDSVPKDGSWFLGRLIESQRPSCGDLDCEVMCYVTSGAYEGKFQSNESTFGPSLVEGWAPLPVPGNASPQPAPQPVEAEGREPVGYVHPDTIKGLRAGLCAKSYLFAKPMPQVWADVPLYTAPPPEQPAIDLEQLQWAANRWKREAAYHANGIADDYGAGQRHAFFSCATELLAIIDGAKGHGGKDE